jgi:hypothetical protein
MYIKTYTPRQADGMTPCVNGQYVRVDDLQAALDRVFLNYQAVFNAAKNTGLLENKEVWAMELMIKNLRPLLQLV